MELNELRKEINETDKKIVEFLEKRFNLAKQVGKYKKKNNMPILDEKRETIVINNCKDYLANNNFSEYIEQIYIEIMNSCKDIQKKIIK